MGKHCLANTAGHCLENTAWRTLLGEHCLENTAWRTLLGEQYLEQSCLGHIVSKSQLGKPCLCLESLFRRAVFETFGEGRTLFGDIFWRTFFGKNLGQHLLRTLTGEHCQGLENSNGRNQLGLLFFGNFV